MSNSHSYYPEDYRSLVDFVTNAPLSEVFEEELKYLPPDNFMSEYIRASDQVFTVRSTKTKSEKVILAEEINFPDEETKTETKIVETQAEESEINFEIEKATIIDKFKTQTVEAQVEETKTNSEIEKAITEDKKRLKYERRQKEKLAIKLKKQAKEAALAVIKQKEEDAKRLKDELKKNAANQNRKNQKIKPTLAELKKSQPQENSTDSLQLILKAILGKDKQGLSKRAAELTNQLIPILALDGEEFKNAVKKVLGHLNLNSLLLNTFLGKISLMKEVNDLKQAINKKSESFILIGRSPEWLDDTLIIEKANIHDIGIFSIFKKSREKLDECLAELGEFIENSTDSKTKMLACYCLLKSIDLLELIILNKNIDTNKVIQSLDLILHDIQQINIASLTPFNEMLVAIKNQIIAAKWNAEKAQRVNIYESFMIRHYNDEPCYTPTMFSSKKKSSKMPSNEEEKMMQQISRCNS